MKKLLALLLSLALMLTLLTGCSGDIMDLVTGWAKDVSSKLEEENTSEVSEKETVHELPTQDMSGNPISVPADIRSVVSLENGVTEILVKLGLGSRLVGVDTASARLDGIASALQVYDASAISTAVDTLISTSPQLMLVPSGVYATLALRPEVLEDDEDAGDAQNGGSTQLSALERLQNAGVCVACVPEPKTLANVMKSTLFVGYCFGLYDESEQIVYDMIEKIQKVKDIADTVPTTRLVYVELEPYVSVGFGELLNEMIGITGAQNVFLSRDNIIRVVDEDVVAANPEIIITCVGDVELDEGANIHTVGEARMNEIATREGWEGISAVTSGTLYYLESSLVPGPDIVDALWELATMCYPSLYK